MSTTSRSSTDDSSFDIEELWDIEARCRELRREKDLLKETQSQSFDFIKRLELHVRRLNEARSEDKMQIQALERELSNCHQEIDYLKDQLNARNTDIVGLQEAVGNLQMKLAGVDLLEDEVVSLREELNKSNSECDFLMHELENKETELQKSSSRIEELEGSIACATLDYECEIESMRLDMLVLEQKCFEAKKSEDAQKTIKNLENENRQLNGLLDASEKKAKLFCQRVEEHFEEWLESNEENELASTSEVGPCGDILGPLLGKLLKIGTSGSDHKRSAEEVWQKLHDYEKMVEQLQEELREEKLRAKDEAEELAQEMAELRYQLTELLEEERKRRSCIEQASLQRISELEAQLQMEKQKFVARICHTCED